MKHTHIRLALAMLFLGTTISACKKVIAVEGGGGSPSRQNLQLLLTDDPPAPDTGGVVIDSMADISAVNLDIRSVSVMMWTDTAQWDSLNITPGICNILRFRNGLDTVLGTTSLDRGAVKALRVVLGDQSTVTANGVTTPLQASTIVVPVTDDTIVLGDQPLQLWMDIDAGHSIVEIGQGAFGLKPFIRLFTAGSATIKGVVAPMAAAPIVGVLSGNDTLVALPGSLGGWEVRGIKTRTVSVIVQPTATGYRDTAFLNVAVQRGQVTDLGTVTLHD